MNPRFPVLLLLASLLFGSAAAATATIEGRVGLPKARTAPVMNKRYDIVSTAGVLSTNPPLAVVYLEGDFSAVPPPTTPAQVGQKDMAFVPALLPVQVGTRVEFPNFDGSFHNIFSYSPAKRFDLGRYRPDEKPVPSVLFDTAGLVVLRCDIHEHMRGLVLVLATPYFVLTDAEGNFRLAGLPVGKYQVKVWIDSRTTLSKAVELGEGAVVRADFP